MIASLFLGVFLGWTTGTPVNTKIPPMKGVFTPAIHEHYHEKQALYFDYVEAPLSETLGKDPTKEK